MDIFVEEIVKKKKTPRDFVLILATLLAGVALLFILVTIVLPILWNLMPIVLLLIAGVCYGIYYILGGFNIEYEYSLVNAEIDIDKIVNRRSRKREVTVYLRELEDFGTIKNPMFNSYKESPEFKKVYVCSAENADNAFFVVYTCAGQRLMVIFNPNERIVSEIKRRNPQKELI